MDSKNNKVGTFRYPGTGSRAVEHSSADMQKVQKLPLAYIWGSYFRHEVRDSRHFQSVKMCEIQSPFL